MFKRDDIPYPVALCAMVCVMTEIFRLGYGMTEAEANAKAASMFMEQQ
jgi:hypothetical protein